MCGVVVPGKIKIFIAADTPCSFAVSSEMSTVIPLTSVSVNCTRNGSAPTHKTAFVKVTFPRI